MCIIRRSINRFLHLLARFSPGAMNIRPFLHKLRGVKIYGKVFIGDEVYIENEHPECIEIHDAAQLAPRVTLIAHFRGTGKIIIGEKAWIGAGCIISASVGQTLTIGAGSLIGAGSVVTKDVPPLTFVGGVPAKPIAKLTIPMTMDVDMMVFRAGLKPLK